MHLEEKRFPYCIRYIIFFFLPGKILLYLRAFRRVQAGEVPVLPAQSSRDLAVGGEGVHAPVKDLPLGETRSAIETVLRLQVLPDV